MMNKMIQIDEKKEKKSNFTSKLPKIGKVSQLILLIGIFAIIFIPLTLIERQQPLKQAELKATLANLEKILAAAPAEDGDLKARIDKISAEIEVTDELYPESDQIFNIIDIVLELALLNDVTVTGMTAKEPEPDEGNPGFISISYVINLKGQVPKFQNFILALDDRFPTSEVSSVSISISAEEETEDTAVIEFNMNSIKSS